jgi:hypothetical protein
MTAPGVYADEYGLAGPQVATAAAIGAWMMSGQHHPASAPGNRIYKTPSDALVIN